MNEISVFTGRNPSTEAVNPDGAPLLFTRTPPGTGVTGSLPLQTPSPLRSTQTCAGATPAAETRTSYGMFCWVARSRASWYTETSVCAAALSFALSMARERVGMDIPTTSAMIDATTSSSAKVKPACEARPSPGLVANFTPASPFFFRSSLLPGRRKVDGKPCSFYLQKSSLSRRLLRPKMDDFCGWTFVPRHTNPGALNPGLNDW